MGSYGGLKSLKQWPKPLKEHLEGGEPSAVVYGERESREAGGGVWGGKWGWTGLVPACTLNPLRCSFLGQPSAATRPRCLRRNCQIKMNHLAHNGRGAYRGGRARGGALSLRRTRPVLTRARAGAGLERAAGRGRGLPNMATRAPQGAKTRASRPSSRGQARAASRGIAVRFYTPSPCALKPGLPLPGLFPGGALSTPPLPPGRVSSFLPPFPLPNRQKRARLWRLPLLLGCVCGWPG